MKRYVKLFESFTISYDEFELISDTITSVLEGEDIEPLENALSGEGWDFEGEQLSAGAMYYNKYIEGMEHLGDMGLMIHFDLNVNKKDWVEDEDGDEYTEASVTLEIGEAQLKLGGLFPDPDKPHLFKEIPLYGLQMKKVIDIPSGFKPEKLRSWIVNTLSDAARFSLAAARQAVETMKPNQIEQMMPTLEDWDRLFYMLYNGDASNFRGGEEAIKRITARFARSLKARNLFGI